MHLITPLRVITVQNLAASLCIEACQVSTRAAGPTCRRRRSSKRVAPLHKTIKRLQHTICSAPAGFSVGYGQALLARPSQGRHGIGEVGKDCGGSRPGRRLPVRQRPRRHAGAAAEQRRSAGGNLGCSSQFPFHFWVLCISATELATQTAAAPHAQQWTQAVQHSSETLPEPLMHPTT